MLVVAPVFRPAFGNNMAVQIVMVIVVVLI